MCNLLADASMILLLNNDYGEKLSQSIKIDYIYSVKDHYNIK